MEIVHRHRPSTKIVNQFTLGPMNRLPAITLATACLSLGGCYAEGHSYFLGDGETERFASMARCEAQATTKYQDGGPMYSGYKCKERLFFLTLEERDYQSGKLAGTIK